MTDLDQQIQKLERELNNTKLKLDSLVSEKMAQVKVQPALTELMEDLAELLQNYSDAEEHIVSTLITFLVAEQLINLTVDYNYFDYSGNLKLAAHLKRHQQVLLSAVLDLHYTDIREED